MKFFKTTLLAGVLSINMVAPVFANQAPITEQIQQFTAADTQSLFEQDAKPMELAALSQTEMKETEGAAIWFAPIAWAGARYALTGFTRHGLNQVISRGGVGVSNQAILSTLRNPTTAYSNIANQTTRYVGQNATVVLNQNGRLVTAWGSPR
jgi:hypothetical protein